MAHSFNGQLSHVQRSMNAERRSSSLTQKGRHAINEERPLEINRRDLLRNAAAVTFAGAVTSAGQGTDAVAQETAAKLRALESASDPTLIRRENKKQGSRD